MLSFPLTFVELKPGFCILQQEAYLRRHTITHRVPERLKGGPTCDLFW